MKIELNEVRWRPQVVCYRRCGRYLGAAHHGRYRNRSALCFHSDFSCLSALHRLRSKDLPAFKNFITEANRIALRATYLRSTWFISSADLLFLPSFENLSVPLTSRMIGVVHKFGNVAVTIARHSKKVFKEEVKIETRDRVSDYIFSGSDPTPKPTNFPMMPAKKFVRIFPKLEEPTLVIEAEKKLRRFIDGQDDAIYLFGFRLY